MTHPTAERNTFPQTVAAQCACCGSPLPTGQGYAVPFIGPVGPKCVQKFAAFAQLLAFVEGRRADPTLSEGARHASGALVAGLRSLGFEVALQGGALHVTRLTRKPAEVVKSWKKRRAEFEQDLKVAAGFFGLDAQRAHLAAVAA